MARREVTRRWWRQASDKYELVTGSAVREELMAGPSDRTSAWLQLIDGLPLLQSNAAVREIAAKYVRHKVMPANPLGDALHLALASCYRCDYLLTWNFKHLANANKFRHIQQVSSLLDLFVPQIVTPPALLGEDHE
ncbi:MAG: type II toxin-antitoxin system VapC family toxin [Longimicrobiaceae bacterium]